MTNVLRTALQPEPVPHGQLPRREDVATKGRSCSKYPGRMQRVACGLPTLFLRISSSGCAKVEISGPGDPVTAVIPSGGV